MRFWHPVMDERENEPLLWLGGVAIRLGERVIRRARGAGLARPQRSALVNAGKLSELSHVM